MNEPTLKETILAFAAVLAGAAMWWIAAILMHMGVL